MRRPWRSVWPSPNWTLFRRTASQARPQSASKRPMSSPPTSLPPEILDRRDRAKAWFETLQQRIVAELERLEDEAPAELYPDEPGRFDLRPWTRETGVGGGIGGFFKGRLFEKGGGHTPPPPPRLFPAMAAPLPGADPDPPPVSAPISPVVHPPTPPRPAPPHNTPLPPPP